jgi:hypothetical protein
MSSRNLFASTLMACFLAADFLGIAPAAKAASAGELSLKPSKGARNYVIENKRRGRPRIHLPIGPSYVYYDYPYYYSRGYYPTHIGGYFYYPYYYSYSRSGDPGSPRRPRARARGK